MTFVSHNGRVVEEDLVIIEKEGDDLLLDLIAARPWLLNKVGPGYSDRGKVDNGWKEVGLGMRQPGKSST